MELKIERDESRGGFVTLKVSGVVNHRTASQLQQAVDAESGPMVIDFSRVREFYDFAVAMLANNLRRNAVMMTGLNDHQRRMFRYFGVETGRRPAATTVTAEALVP